MPDSQHQTPLDAQGIATPKAAAGVSLRSVLLALAVSSGAALLAVWHDGVIAHREISAQNYLAPLPLAMVFLFVLVVNALLWRVHRRSALSGAELAVVLALSVIANPLPRFVAANLVGTIGYTQALIDSRHASAGDLAKTNIYGVLPQRALLDAGDSRQFDDGLAGRVGEWANPAKLPWRVWVAPLLSWAPLVVCFLALSVSMGYTLYQQWARRELVPFPLAELGAALLRHERQRPWPDIFYNRAFWIGLLLTVFIFGVNGLHAHVEKMIQIPTRFQFYELADKFPFLRDSHEGYSLVRGWVFFTVVAVAVLLPGEISFTSWFTWPVMVVASYVFFLRTGQKYGEPENQMVLAGAWWAMAALILYAGRHYYLGLVRSAVGLASKEPIDRQSTWACRVLLASAVGLLVILKAYGIPLDIAAIWVLCLLMFMLVTCRLVAEMGIPWTPLSNVGPLPMMLLTLGERALGAKVYALLAVLGNVMLPARGTMVLLAPAVANAAHIEARVAGRVVSGKVLGPFVLAALFMCVALAIWMGYSSEGEANDYHTPYAEQVKAAATSIQAMLPPAPAPAPGRDTAADLTAALHHNTSFGERWGAARLDPRFLPLFSFGVALVLITGVLRLKFPRFPLHPLPLVLLGSWLMSRFWFSFLLGWLIKKAILKIGGGALFERSRPFFVGLVTGQAVILLLWVSVNIVLYQQQNYTANASWWGFLQDVFSF